MTNTPIDRESVERLMTILVRDAKAQTRQPVEMTGLSSDDEYEIADTLLALRAALDAAEAENKQMREEINTFWPDYITWFRHFASRKCRSRKDYARAADEMLDRAALQENTNG